MRLEVSEKWVEYLGQRRRRKVIGLMRQGNDRDVFGHLCDLYKEETGFGQWVQHTKNGAWYFQDSGGNADFIFPPLAVASWAGLKIIDYSKEVNENIQEALAVINDTTEGWTRLKRNIRSLGKTGELSKPGPPSVRRAETN